MKKENNKNKPLTRKQKDFLKVFEISAGNISVTCKKTRVSRETFYRWGRENENFNKQVGDTKESLLDFAESVLMRKIKDGDNACLIFFLKTKGKKRGYSERFEVENKDVENFSNDSQIHIYLPKKDE